VTVGLTRGGSTAIQATQPSPPITPIQIRRCRWLITHGRRVHVLPIFGYLIVVSPGRRYWRATRRSAIDLARRIRSQTITP